MVQVLREEIMVGFPDTPVFVQRGSLHNVDGNNSRELRLDFQGADLVSLMDAARVAVDEVPRAIPGTYPQAFPGLELNRPELRLVPDECRIELRAVADRGGGVDSRDDRRCSARCAEACS